jgi:hypothetical protein
MKTIRFTFPKRLTGPGRTMRQATDDGTFYRLEKDGKNVGEFPGAATIREACRCAIYRRFIISGDTVEVLRHLPGSSIGAAILERVETVRVEVMP